MPTPPIPLSFSSNAEETLSGAAYDITQSGGTVKLHFTAPSVFLHDSAQGGSGASSHTPPTIQTLTFGKVTLQGTNDFNNAYGTFTGEELDNNGTFNSDDSVVTIDTLALAGQGMFFIFNGLLTLDVGGIPIGLGNSSTATNTATATNSGEGSRSSANNTAAATQTNGNSGAATNVNVSVANPPANPVGSGVGSGQTFEVRDDGTLAIDDPNAFHGNIIVAEGASLFEVFLKDIQADAYDFNGSTLRLFKANQVVDSVAFTNHTGGVFSVIQSSERFGIDITNEHRPGALLPLHP